MTELTEEDYEAAYKVIDKLRSEESQRKASLLKDVRYIIALYQRENL